MLQFGASLTDDTRSVNYDRKMFIKQATDGSTSPKYKFAVFHNNKKLQREERTSF